MNCLLDVLSVQADIFCWHWGNSLGRNSRQCQWNPHLHVSLEEPLSAIIQTGVNGTRAHIAGIGEARREYSIATSERTGAIQLPQKQVVSKES